MDRTKRIALVVFTLAAVASCIAPPFPRELALQHIPTVIAIVLLAITRTSRTSFFLMLAFLGLL